MARKRHRLVQQVAGTVRAHGLLPDGARIVVGLSGGPDSVALAAALAELAGGRSRWQLTLAHLHHGLRGKAATRDETFVVGLADRWRLPLVSHREDVRRLAAERRLGVEEAAREARYAFFDRVAAEVRATHVAVGHHADDQAETVLMNVLRGSGLRGLSGMPIMRPLSAGSRVALVRPLLETRRAEILDYLAARGLAAMDDETNRSPAMRRNRVRHELLPMLERDYAPGLGRRLVQMADSVRGALEMVAGRAAGVWDEAALAATGDAVTFDLEVLRREGRAVTAELLVAALERLAAGRGSLSAEHLAAAWRLVAGERGGRAIELPGGITVSRRGRRVRIGR